RIFLTLDIISDRVLMMNVQDKLADLVLIDSVSSLSNAEIISYLESHCLGHGLRCKRFPHNDNGIDKFNLVAQTHPAADVELALVGHTDTVPYDPSWIDALRLTEKDGKLFGRGACDTKAFIAAALTAIEKIDLTKLKKPLAL